MSTKLHLAVTLDGHVVDGFLTGGNKADISMEDELTEEIFGCTPQTLKSFERRELIKPSRFKNRNYYSASEILSCIKKQIPNYGKISKKDMEWHDIWGE